MEKCHTIGLRKATYIYAKKLSSAHESQGPVCITEQQKYNKNNKEVCNKYYI